MRTEPVAFVDDPAAPEWVDDPTAPVFVGNGTEDWAADVLYENGSRSMWDLESVLGANPTDILSGESLDEAEIRDRLGIEEEGGQ